MRAIGHEHQPEICSLFIDSNEFSLKDVLLHNGNEYPSILVAIRITVAFHALGTADHDTKIIMLKFGQRVRS